MSCWKLGEGQCWWNQERAVGGLKRWHMAVSSEVLGRNLPATAKGRNDHMAEEVQREMNEGQARAMMFSNDTQTPRVVIL